MEFIWMEEWQAILFTEGDNFAGAPIQYFTEISVEWQQKECCQLAGIH